MFIYIAQGALAQRITSNSILRHGEADDVWPFLAVLFSSWELQFCAKTHLSVLLREAIVRRWKPKCTWCIAPIFLHWSDWRAFAVSGALCFAEVALPARVA